MISQNTPIKLTRRNWLRDAALTAASAAVLPSLLSGCADHLNPDPVKGVLLDPPITPDELAAAALNMVYMRAWYEDLYAGRTQPYILRVYTLLKGGEVAPKSWKEILVDIFTEIGIGILEAAVSEIPGAGAAISATAKAVEKWAMEKKAGKGVDATISEFIQGYDNMHDVISDNLLSLASSFENYKYLQDAFKDGPIEFNGKKYTLRDLAQQHFPDKTNSADTEQYRVILDAAELKFKIYIWNAMFMKAGTMTYFTEREVSYHGLIPGDPANNPTRYAREQIYNDPDNAARFNAVYMRSYYSPFVDLFYFRQYYWEFDGRLLSEATVNELFKDDTPEHIINPTGLFLRSYVFKQFHTKKPDFAGYHNLRKDLDWGPLTPDDSCWALECPDNYEFTGGLFPALTKK